MPTRADVRALGEFAASRHGTFTLRQAAAHGVSAQVVSRLQADGTVVRVRTGVYRFVAVAPSWRSATYAATVKHRVVAARRSAAALHRVEGLERPPAVPQLSCHHHDRVTLQDADVRRTSCLPKSDVTEVDGIKCTTLERTLIDIAPHVTHDQLVRAVDDAQRRRLDMGSLLARAESLARRGRSGPRQIAEIVRRRLHGYVLPDSYFERLLAECMRSPVLHGITRQYELCTEGGTFVARFDLAIPWVRLGLEGHSRSFHLGEAVERYDEDRDLRVAQQGWDTTYLGFAATRAPAAVRRDIEIVVERRARDLGLTPPPISGSRSLPRSV